MVLFWASCGVVFLAVSCAVVTALDDAETRTKKGDEPKTLKISLQTHKKYKTLQDYIRFLQQPKTGSIPVRHQDTYYYGSISLGTPGQNFLVDFETNNPYIWVPSIKCVKSNEFCESHKKYDSSKSSTYKKNGQPFNLTDFSGTRIIGFTSEDVLEVQGERVVGQLFGEATIVKLDLVKEPLYDGLFGLNCNKEGSQIPGDPPLLNMVKQGVIHHSVFAFYLDKVDYAHAKGWRSELMLGGVDPDHYTGNFTFTPITNTGIWMFNIEGFRLGSKLIIDKAYPIVAAIGSSFIFVPDSTLNAINDAIGAVKISETIYQIDCSKMSSIPDVSFIINKTAFVLQPVDYVLMFKETDMCISRFTSSGFLPYIILGDSFMRKFYTQFDWENKRIGFATAK